METRGGCRQLDTLQRLRDTFLVETGRLLQSFFDSLKESRFFLFCCLAGSYITLQEGYNLATRRGPHFPNPLVFLLGLAMRLAGPGVRCGLGPVVAETSYRAENFFEVVPSENCSFSVTKLRLSV